MAAAAPAIGLGIAAVGASGRWSPPDAIIDADFAGGRFAFAGRRYLDKPGFLAAIGGSEASGAISVGPYIAPDAPELISNGGFDAGAAGWTTTQTGLGPATGAVVGGVYVVSGNNANSPFVGQGIAVTPGRAYRARGKVRGAGSVGANFWITPNANGSGFMGSIGAINITTNLVETACTFATVGATTTMYVGARAIYNPATGSFGIDDYSCRECAPFAGFVPMAISGLIEATTPAAAGGVKVLWQIDDGATDFAAGTATERNYVRLYWDASRHLRLAVSCQATIGSATPQADLDLGIVEVSTAFRVAFSAAPGSFVAALGDGPAVADTSGSFPGVARMRIGRGQASWNNWGGTIGRLTLFPTSKTVEEVENFAAGTTGSLVAAWGDSLTAGTGASGAATAYPAIASSLFTPDRAISNQGVGGQNSTQIAARMNARPILVTVSGNRIPAAGGVAVTAKSINVLASAGTFTGSLAGSLAGVRGTMSTDASGNWTFIRALDGAMVGCAPDTPFVGARGRSLRQRTTWLWLGRNGAQSGFTIAGDIAAAVAHLNHPRYLVGAILTSAADDPTAVDAIVAINAVLAASYGARFVDLMQALQDANDGSPDDLADIASGWVPRSLRSDSIHLDDSGYAVVAATFKTANDAMAW